MFKYLKNDTWAYIKDEEILVQAKIWYYPQLPVEHSLYKVGLIGEFKCEEKTRLNESKAFLEKLVGELKGLGEIGRAHV